METKDHYQLSKVLAEQMKLGTANRLAFVFGNIIPDFNPFSYISGAGSGLLMGHSYNHRRTDMEKALSQSCTNTPYWWFRAGKMIHYLADSFTRPHNENFGYSYTQHVDYEHRLHLMLHPRLKATKLSLLAKESGHFTPIREWLDQRHSSYIKNSRGAVDDCNYILGSVTLALAKHLYPHSI